MLFRQSVVRFMYQCRLVNNTTPKYVILRLPGFSKLKRSVRDPFDCGLDMIFQLSEEFMKGLYFQKPSGILNGAYNADQRHRYVLKKSVGLQKQFNCTLKAAHELEWN